MHCVFSTKGRCRTITPDLRDRLWPFLGGIARENGMKAISIGGMEDHVHVLLSIPATETIAKAVQLLKGASSRWVHAEFPERGDFAWQEGYGAFSIGASGIDATVDYINSQTIHHKKRTFEEEFVGLLKRYGMDYDERYLFG